MELSHDVWRLVRRYLVRDEVASAARVWSEIAEDDPALARMEPGGVSSVPSVRRTATDPDTRRVHGTAARPYARYQVYVVDG